MSLIINTNISSLTAQRNLGLNNDQLHKSLERLSSGLRVNRAADDAAGLAIANKLNFQARGLNQAVRNAGDAASLVQTAEGSFNVATNILGRLRELAVQSASDTNTTADRATLKSEADLLVAELTRLASTTQFNDDNLLDGSFASGKIQVAASVNAAGITNVTARVNSDYTRITFVATKGTDIRLAYSTAGGTVASDFASAIGLAVLSQVGSGNDTNAISNFNGQSGAIAKVAAINSVSSKSGVQATALANVVSSTTAVVAG